MDAVALKGRLHEYIDRADNKHLEAMYVLLEKDMEPAHKYDDATLEMFYQRRENHLNGKSKSYTAEEVFDFIRNTKKK